MKAFILAICPSGRSFSITTAVHVWKLGVTRCNPNTSIYAIKLFQSSLILTILTQSFEIGRISVLALSFEIGRILVLALSFEIDRIPVISILFEIKRISSFSLSSN